MNVVFRVDASIQMGTGHVMRCLTLADELSKQGSQCHFICREHPGNLITIVSERGHQTHSLVYDDAPPQAVKKNKAGNLVHSAWLGTTQEADAALCIALVQQLQADWLIVDHYALDACWEKALKPYCYKIMVIDDLADRQHVCDFLLDQNYGSITKRYQGLVPERCIVLAGTQFALLRPEFAQWREFSLNRRQNNIMIDNILVTLGGADPDNYTGKILEQLAITRLNPQVEITVIMGATAPHLIDIKQQAATMPVKTQVKVSVSNMAELMSKADLAIGAAGSTTWERCCLGLPTIQLVVADNQRRVAKKMADDNIVKMLEQYTDLLFLLSTAPNWLENVSLAAASVCDGQGVSRIQQFICA